MQKRGLADRNCAGDAPRLVKLQRPPPEMRIFSPGADAASSTSTVRPRAPAAAAHIMPAAPAPITTTSKLLAQVMTRLCRYQGVFTKVSMSLAARVGAPAFCRKPRSRTQSAKRFCQVPNALPSRSFSPLPWMPMA